MYIGCISRRIGGTLRRVKVGGRIRMFLGLLRGCNEGKKRDYISDGERWCGFGVPDEISVEDVGSSHSE